MTATSSINTLRDINPPSQTKLKPLNLAFVHVRYTCRDEEIANEFEATLLGCDSLIGQVSTLLADALKNLKNASRADDSAGPVDEAMPVNAVSRGYIADEENDDDDEDYSSCSLSDDTDG